MKKRLLLFTTTKLDDMLEKGNVWYVSYYETYFDEVYVLYLRSRSRRKKIIKNGNTTLISVGKGNYLFDLFFSPFSLLNISIKMQITHHLTADIIYSWWTTIMLKIIRQAKIFLMPVCMPENILKTSGKTYSGFPVIIEKIFIKLSFLSANKILTAYSYGQCVSWLKKYKQSRKKIRIVSTLAEALSTPAFFKKIEEYENKTVKKNNSYISLLYVGRLHKEKLIYDLIEMMSKIQEYRPQRQYNLTLIGNGNEKLNLLLKVERMGLNAKVKFVDFIKNEDLVSYYYESDIFVSTLTGQSLREAALCGLPVVAYNTDWIKEILKHEDNCLLVQVRNIKQLASEVIRLSEDERLRKKISKNIKKYAWINWGKENLKLSLRNAFK